MTVDYETGEIVEQRPEVPLQIITPADVRASIRRAKASLVEDDEPTPDATTDPEPSESAAIATTCPTCHGTGKVTR